MDMQTPNMADENLKKLMDLFPNIVTETIGEDGNVVRAIDKDKLEQEISTKVIEGKEERYEFIWPEKKKSIIAANAPTTNTLRPCVEESVNFDTTKNLYIEGDNLEVLKILQETYLGKVKMIYIDPPYNTGSDFVYEDDFAEDMDEYIERSGQLDEEGNQLVVNKESNGRFHTDWLNMMYPRLKMARNLLSDDGVIFISIDDGEQANLKKICDEVFGEINFINSVSIKMSELSGTKMANVNKYPKLKETLLIYSKNFFSFQMIIEKNNKSNEDLKNYLGYYNYIIRDKSKEVYSWEIVGIKEYLKENNLEFTDIIDLNRWKIENADRIIYRTNSKTVNTYLKKYPDSNYIEEIINNKGKKIIKWGNKEMLFLENYLEEYLGDIWLDISTINLNKENHNLNWFKKGQKPIKLLKRIIKSCNSPAIVLDFFAGSSTTAQAVIELNAEEELDTRFIMVQLPENLDESVQKLTGEAKNETSELIKFLDSIDKPHLLTEIGKERIRRAGKKIKEDFKEKEGIEDLDIGFRVLKLDSSNMEDVYYNPMELQQDMLSSMRENIKNDRTDLDLLFQVMLDLGIEISSKIDEFSVEGKRCYIVEDGFLIACFDENIDTDFVKEIAKKKPYYAVITDRSMHEDSLLTNFEQIFKEISPDTVQRVL